MVAISHFYVIVGTIVNSGLTFFFNVGTHVNSGLMFGKLSLWRKTWNQICKKCVDLELEKNVSALANMKCKHDSRVLHFYSIQKNRFIFSLNLYLMIIYCSGVSL